MTTEYDVIIAGGGMTGLVTASSVAKFSNQNLKKADLSKRGNDENLVNNCNSKHNIVIGNFSLFNITE